MTLPTQGHKVTLKAHALANQATVEAGAGTATIASLMAAPSLGSGDAQLISDWYNDLTNPEVYAWKFSIGPMDLRRAVLNTAGSANQLDNLTGSKRDSILWAIDDTLDCRLLAVRTSIEDLCGSQNTLKAAIINALKRHVTRVQAVFCVGTGSEAVPADNATNGGFESSITGNDISDIHGIPS